MTPRRIGILADDLTGAGDAAVPFSERGFRVELSLRRGSRPAPPSVPADVWVIDTDSRHVPAPEAARRVRAAVAALQRWGAGFIYKKVDSALRGPVAAEMKAFLKALPAEDLPLVFVPAFPRMGRTTVKGEQRVFGVPVHRTAFGRDPRHPVRTAAISARLGASAGSCWAPDVPGERALREAAKAVLAGRRARSAAADRARRKCREGAAAGSGGFAEELARLWRPRRPRRLAVPRGHAPVLVVAGSRHPVTRRQVRHLRKAFRGRLLDLLTMPLNSATKSSSILLAAAPAGRERSETVMAALLGKAVPAARRLNVRCYVATGGETAGRLCLAMGWTRLRVTGRFETGAPLCVPAEDGAAKLVLKPGAFGGPRSLVKAARMLGA